MPNERVLLIEDAQAPRSFLSRTLGKIATVVHARSILEGTVQLATMSPKAIIMDWSMPDGNALEGMPEILSIQDDVPVIVLCADLTVDRAVDLMRAGAHDVLPKTIEEDTLQMAVFRAIHADIKMNYRNVILPYLSRKINQLAGFPPVPKKLGIHTTRIKHEVIQKLRTLQIAYIFPKTNNLSVELL